MEHGGGPIDLLTVVRTVAETGSTNTDLLELARSGVVEEGVWLRAGRQTAGRGRQGRGWVSPGGAVHASTAVRLRKGDPSAPSLALVAGIAVAETAGQFASGLAIKWPNDVMFDGAKLAGILLERIDDTVVVGCGVNLLDAPELPDRRTTSLAAAGATIDAATFTVLLAERFDAWLARWRGEGLPIVIARWLSLAHPPGTPLRVALPDSTAVAGTFAGLTGAGALRLRLQDASERVIHAGEVFAV